MPRKPKKQQSTLTDEEKLLAQYARVLVRHEMLRQMVQSDNNNKERSVNGKQQE
ncbi:MAG: hypothetical protein K1X91_00915 [Bacteriodetes bacterium]|nr:hypothetical protein [Bacteroidota bacterium]